MPDPFDWNGDGKLDSWEETNKTLFIYNQVNNKANGSGISPGRRTGSNRIGIFILAFVVLAIIALVSNLGRQETSEVYRTGAGIRCRCAYEVAGQAVREQKCWWAIQKGNLT